MSGAMLPHYKTLPTQNIGKTSKYFAQWFMSYKHKPFLIICLGLVQQFK